MDHTQLQLADAQTYRQGMRHVAGATCIITAQHDGKRGGLTVTSVTSVAIEPPELLVCVNINTSAWPLIEKSGRFGVNVLTLAQQQSALQFAGVGQLNGDQRYSNANWTEHNGIWLLDEAPAVFACEVSEIIIRHSHALVLGSVQYVRCSTDTNTQPMLYWQGQFGTIKV